MATLTNLPIDGRHLIYDLALPREEIFDICPTTTESQDGLTRINRHDHVETIGMFHGSNNFAVILPDNDDEWLLRVADRLLTQLILWTICSE